MARSLFRRPRFPGLQRLRRVFPFGLTPDIDTINWVELYKLDGYGFTQAFGTGGNGQFFTSNGGTAPAWSGAALAPGGRLSLSSTAAVQTADVVGGTTIYYLPHGHAWTPVG